MLIVVAMVIYILCAIFSLLIVEKGENKLTAVLLSPVLLIVVPAVFITYMSGAYNDFSFWSDYNIKNLFKSREPECILGESDDIELNELGHAIAVDRRDCIDSIHCNDNTINSIIDSRENIRSLLLKLQKEN